MSTLEHRYVYNHAFGNNDGLEETHLRGLYHGICTYNMVPVRSLFCKFEHFFAFIQSRPTLPDTGL